MNGCTEGKDAGKQVLSCSFGSKSYFGLCDPGSPINIIPYSLYAKIYNDIAPRTLEPTDVSLSLQIRLIGNLVVSLGMSMLLLVQLIYPIDIFVLGIAEDKDCPIVFRNLFLNVAGADINKKSISLKLGR